MSGHDTAPLRYNPAADNQPCERWTGDIIGWALEIMRSARDEDPAITLGDAAEGYDRQIADHIKGWAIEYNGAAWIARHPDGQVTIRLPESVAKLLKGE